MTATMDIVESKVRGWIANRRAPHGLNEQQAAAVTEEIVAVVKKHAPASGREAWAGELLEQVMSKAKGFACPSPDVWALAAGAANHKAAQLAPAPSEPTATDRRFESFCERLNSGLPVSEHDLFSAQVVDRALEAGRVHLTDVENYQRAAFRARAAVHNPGKALEWLSGQNPALAEKIAAESGRQVEIRKPYSEGMEE